MRDSGVAIADDNGLGPTGLGPTVRFSGAQRL